MTDKIEGILIGSENAKKLADFYKETVGLPLEDEYEMGEGDSVQNGYYFKLTGVSLMIMDHSEVKGKNSSPGRFMINYEVDDLEAEGERLKKAGVKVVAEMYHIEEYGYVTTFEDPDGNYFQLVKTHE